MQRTISFFLALSLILCLFAGCGPQESTADPEASATTEATPPVTTTAPTTEPTTESTAEPTTESAIEPALVDGQSMKIGVICYGLYDDENGRFFQPVTMFAEERGISYEYYKAAEETDEAALVSIVEAVEDGVNVVICRGSMFECAVYEAQKLYPNVRFLLFNGEAHSADLSSYETTSNTRCILFREEQMGYLAGYAAVMEGYRTIGVVSGLELPPLVYVYNGFMQGATDAAVKLGVVDEILIKHHKLSCGVFHDDDYRVLDRWIDGEVDMIYAIDRLSEDICVRSDLKGVPTISVITNMAYAAENVIGAIVYDYTSALELALTILVNGNGEWPEGNSTMILGAEENGIRLLPDGEGWKFRNFTEEDYKALYAEIAEGKIIIPRTFEIGEIPFTVEYM